MAWLQKTPLLMRKDFILSIVVVIIPSHSWIYDNIDNKKYIGTFNHANFSLLWNSFNNAFADKVAILISWQILLNNTNVECLKRKILRMLHVMKGKSLCLRFQGLQSVDDDERIINWRHTHSLDESSQMFIHLQLLYTLSLPMAYSNRHLMILKIVKLNFLKIQCQMCLTHFDEITSIMFIHFWLYKHDFMSK